MFHGPFPVPIVLTCHVMTLFCRKSDENLASAAGNLVPLANDSTKGSVRGKRAPVSGDRSIKQFVRREEDVETGGDGSGDWSISERGEKARTGSSRSQQSMGRHRITGEPIRRRDRACQLLHQRLLRPDSSLSFSIRHESVSGISQSFGRDLLLHQQDTNGVRVSNLLTGRRERE